MTQTAYDDNAEIDDAASKETVDGEKDAVVVADGEDEHADSSNLDDGCAYRRLTAITTYLQKQ